MRALLAIVLLAAACDREIQMQLVAAPEARDSDADLSCVTSVSVLAYGNDSGDPPTFACRSVPSPGIERITDLPVPGSVALDVPPSGLAYMVVRGQSGRAGQCDGWTVFAADAIYDGGDTITLPAVPNLDCNNRDGATWTVRAIDFLHYLDTRQCTPPPDATTLNLTVGTFRSAVTGGWYDFQGNETPVAADGTAQIAGMFLGGEFGSCVAADVYNFPVVETLTCIYPDRPSPCGGGASEVVVPFAAEEELDDSYDSALFASWGSVAVGVIVDSATGAPFANTTISLVDPEAGQLVYTSYAGRRLTARAAPTDTSGTFMLYSASPVEIEVDAPGRGARRFQVGGWFDGVASPVVLVM